MQKASLQMLPCRYGFGRRLRNMFIAMAVMMGVTGPALAEPLRIIAFGDSLTAGYGLPEGEGLVPQLQNWLQAKGEDVVIENAGVSGDTTAGGLARIDWALSNGGDGLIVTLGGNDMLRGLPPASVRQNLSGILDAAGARGLPVLLVGMHAPANWGPDYKAAFDAAYPDLARETGALLAPDFFEGLRAAGADPADPASLAAYMQADGIHPNAEGVRLIVEGLGPQVQALIAKAKQGDTP